MQLDSTMSSPSATPPIPPLPPPLQFNLIHASKAGNPSPCSGVSRRVSKRLLLSRLRDDA